jgi:DNA repair exonuclease SbcCD nuclease subunit
MVGAPIGRASRLVDLLHVSDTHLGHQAYNRLSADGLNQREVDFQDAFRRVVDHAIGREPDLVVHSGDLFDVVRPSNRAIALTLQQVRRLSEAKIPFVVVSGNHEAPRLRETGSILRVFEGLPHVHPIYRGAYEAVPVQTRGGRITIHGVPQSPVQAEFANQLALAKPEGNGSHVLALHGTVAGVDGLFSSEINEMMIPANALGPEYDYIALGHFHNHRRVTENAAYAGSTERTSFSEAGEDKVFLEVTLDGARPTLRPRTASARPMRDAGVIDLHGASRLDVAAEAVSRLAAVSAPGAIVRLLVRGLDPASLRVLDVGAIRAAAPDVLHLDLRFELRSDEAHQQSVPELGSLSAEFEAFLKAHPLAGVERDAVRAQALRLLQEGASVAP